jgi:hypothetical protein
MKFIYLSKIYTVYKCEHNQTRNELIIAVKVKIPLFWDDIV